MAVQRSAAHLRRASMVMATLASGALLAACGGTAVPAGADGELAGVVASDVKADRGTADHGTGQGNGHGQGKGRGHGHGHGNGGDEGESVVLPDSWAGTISTETLPESSGTQYLLMQYLFGNLQHVTEMSGDQIEGMEFFSGEPVDCEGDVSLSGGSSLCLYEKPTDDGTVQIPIEARLVPVAFGSSALLFSADTDGFTNLSIPQDTVLGVWSVEAASLADVTSDDVASAAFDAILMADRPDGDVPPEIAIDCTLLDGGAHAVCEVSGTTDEGSDGTWYATAQPAYQDGSIGYVFSKLPA